MSGCCDNQSKMLVLMCREYGKMVHGNRFSLELNGFVYMSYVRPAFLYVS